MFPPAPAVAVQKLRLGSAAPQDSDLHGAAQALIRLQDVYELDISQLSEGKIGRMLSCTSMLLL